MAKRKQHTAADQFNTTLRCALEHVDDTAWLAAHSPLATPYFLGRHLDTATATDEDEQRGSALQQVLQQALADLWPGTLPSTRKALEEAVDEVRQLYGNKGDRYAYLLLEVRYFRNYFGRQTYPATTKAIPQYLLVSTTRFFVHLEEAITRLGELLLRRLQPTLRLEQPRLSTPFIGRRQMRDSCVQVLKEQKSVALSGTGGIGKTTLGTAIAAQWPAAHVFWYTFRPKLNDNLHSLLFALSHFIQQHVSSTLWLQLLADTGQAAAREQLLGLLRGDLARLQEAHITPLLCFDEVDLLHTAESSPRAPAHADLLELLEALRDEAPLLLIGQRAYIDTGYHVALTPFDLAATQDLLAHYQLVLAAGVIERIHAYTQGIPRLVALVAVLLQSGDDPAAVLTLHQRAETQPLFTRLWHRLDDTERELLAALSVFRSAVPADAWTKHQAALNSLVQRQVLTRDAHDAVTPLPFVKALVYKELRPEQRELLHQQAARLRALRAAYTAAAYHFWQAGSWEEAVAVWYPHRTLEIRRGHSRAALEIFGNLSTTRLQSDSRKRLKLIQNELYLLAGQTERVVQGMATYTWEMDDTLSATAFSQWGDAERAGGRFDTAADHYGQALTVLAQQTNEMMRSFFGRMQVEVGQADLQSARHTVAHAQFTLLKLNGFLAFSAQNYPAARDYFEQALPLAKQHDLTEELAATHLLLVVTLGRMGQVDAVETHAEAAMRHYQALGNRLLVETVRAEAAGVYLNVRQFEQVIPPSEQALHFFEQIGHTPRIASLCNNLAEAYLETGDLTQARQYALRVLQLEEQRSLPYAFYTLGLVQQREGHADHALTSLRGGIEFAERNGDRFIAAYLQRVLGRLYLARQEHAAARQALEQAVALFDDLQLNEEAAATVAELAAIDC